MEIKVNFLDKLRLQAKFDDFTVLADQPIRYKAMAPRRGRLIIFGVVGFMRGLFCEAVLRDARHLHRAHPPVAK